ncbi:MAG: LicD family protein [Lachnospiraceae bacterium]|jgi:lipopolysaccharide cholinephosphotransferase|nr:LicD family protein [uncultured Acetatifactor sp.]MCI9573144.1 LicD family protein [Lachnospiraceae bacterium]
MPHNEETLEIHKDLLQLLKRFHLICDKNNIKYSLHGGTLLGCIRENGFIPWDDDLDISIKREEYDSLRAALLNSDDLVLDESTNRFPQLWLKIDGRDPVWLDIFIWDGISENRVVQKIKIGVMCFFLAFLKSKKTMKLSTESKKYVGLKHIIIYLIFLLGKVFPNDFKHKLAEWFGQRMCGKKIFIHRSNDLYAGMKLVLPSYVMQDYIFHDFEGSQMMISRFYHEILESSYGQDYMTPIKTTENAAYTHSLARKLYKK